MLLKSSTPKSFLDLPPEVIGHVYDFLEIQERAALNAALPKDFKVRTTLKTDAKQDAGIRAIARYMKLPSNAGKRYSDLVGKARAKSYGGNLAGLGDFLKTTIKIYCTLSI